MRFLATVILGAVVSTNSAAQSPPALEKGPKVILRVPFAVLDTVAEKPYLKAIGYYDREKIRGGRARVDGGVLRINGRTDWLTDGFLGLTVMKLDQVKRMKEEKETVLRLTAKGYADIVFVVPTAQEMAVWQALTADTTEAEAIDAASLAAMRAKLFTGPLATLSRGTQDGLLKFSRLLGADFGTEEFKDRRYFTVDIGSLGSVYNELKLNESQRVAEVTKTLLLDQIKRFAGIAKEVDQASGLKVQLSIPHKSFLETYARPKHDRLEMYLPLDAIRAFAAADMTSQKLLDASIVLVNGNRVEVNLEGR